MSRPHLALHGKILLGLVLGTLAGVVASGLWEGSTGLERVIVYVAQPVGQIFLRMLLMVVVPLVFTTLVLGIAGLGDLRRLGRMGAKTLGFFVATTCLAAVLGLLVVNIVRPGEPSRLPSGPRCWTPLPPGLGGGGGGRDRSHR